jgi:ribokinase
MGMITVFGSINVDMVMRVESLPRPGETVLCPDYLLVPGGKGANQALAAARAGATVAMIGSVGRDSFADTALSLLRREAIDLSAVALSARPTCCAAVWVDKAGENAIVVASGANLDTRATQMEGRHLQRGDWLMLQMEVPPDANWKAVSLARSAGARIMLSAAPAGPIPERVLRGIDILLVNRIEGQMVADAVGIDAAKPADIVSGLTKRFGFSCVMTLGAEGAICFGPSGGFHAPALAVSPVDTTGAGDAFAGILCASLELGGGMEEAVRRASAGAALACTKIGAQPSLPYAKDIDAATRRLAGNRPFGLVA